MMKQHFFVRALIAVLWLSSSVIHAESAQEQGVLNMKDVDIRVFVEEVGKLTGKTFVIDPRVKGTVTVISQHPMDKALIYQVFQSTLKLHGFAAVETGPVVKIVQDTQAKSEDVPLLGDDSRAVGDAPVTQVIKVHNVDVTALVPVLRTLVPQQGHMAPYKPSNMIIVYDRAANVQRLEKIIQQVDKAGDQEIEIIPLEHASALEVVRIVENLKKDSAQKDDVNRPTVVADERTNSVLISGDIKNRLYLRSLIANMDLPVERDAGSTKVIYLNYAKADKVVKVLQGVSEGIETAEDGKKPAQPPAAAKKRKDVIIEPHEETNAVVINGPPDVVRSLETVIHQLDIPRAQVLVEAIIVEIADSKLKELGIQWLFGGGKNSSVQPIGFSNFGNSGVSINSIAGAAAAAKGSSGKAGDNGESLAKLLAPVEGLGFGVGRFKDSGLNFAMFVRALQQDSGTNILSTPSITTLDNQEASIIVGQEIPIITQQQTGNQNNQNPFNSIERKKIGVKLKITPQINEGNAVRLEIAQEVSSLAAASAAAKTADVVTNTREINTAVLVQDGGTIVLGGLIEDRVLQSEHKVPLLGDIPGLGRLFRSNSTSKDKANLLVFIRPTIIRDNARMMELSSRKYNYLRTQQQGVQQKGISLMPEETTSVLPPWNDQLSLPPAYEEALKKLPPSSVPPPKAQLPQTKPK